MAFFKEDTTVNFDENNKYYFLSYSRADYPRLEPIFYAMQRRGIRIWTDQQIPSGEDWDTMIARKIRKSSSFLMFISQNTFEKERKNSYVYKEYMQAKKHNKDIFFIIMGSINDAKLSDSWAGFWVDVRQAQNISYDSITDSIDDLIRKIITVIENDVGEEICSSDIIYTSALQKTLKSKKKNPEQYTKTWFQPYGLLVTDINGVLFDKRDDGTEEFPDIIVNCFAQLAKQHVSICFTTGRGRTGARYLLLNLAQKIIETSASLSWESLSNEWVCITHNGAYLLSTPDKSKSGFLANQELLCPEMHAEMSTRDDRFFKAEYKKIIRNVCKKERLDFSIINYSISKEPVSFRFSLEHCPPPICEKIFSGIESFCKKQLANNQKYKWYATRGKYEQKEMFEYSLVNKNDAVRDYIRRYHSIDHSNIIRVADMGQQGGSDHSFLLDGPSFSVDKITEENENTCFPVVNWDTGEILSGTEATVYLLEHLHFYPSLCLKSVIDTTQYKLSFVNAIKDARQRSESIFKFYDTRLAWMDFLYEDISLNSSNVSRIFDVKSGAITFSDYEWARIEQFTNEQLNLNVPEYDQVCCFTEIVHAKLPANDSTTQKPQLSYFLHTDTHVLFRGYLYYNFLAKSSSEKFPEGTDTITARQWSDIYVSWLKDAQNFIRLFEESVRSLINTSRPYGTLVPIGYLARKLILGGLDNIRNILLILAYYYLRQYVTTSSKNEGDFLIGLDGSDNPSLITCNKILKLLSDCISCMYTALFESQIDTSFLADMDGKLFNNLRELFDNPIHIRDSAVSTSVVSNIFPNGENENDSVIQYFSETFQRWRESDCFIENIAAIELYLSKIPNENQKMVFWGIPYGSLEHPVLACLLCKKHGFDTDSIPRYVMLHGIYETRHMNDFTLNVHDCPVEEENAKNNIETHVLIDDTLTTATTLDLAVKCLCLHNISVNDIIVIRYAGLNRINHYLTNLVCNSDNNLNASAPDTRKFFNMISGLVAEAPYSKLHKYGLSNKKPYEDALGVFDKSKKRIKNYLIANYDIN